MDALETACREAVDAANDALSETGANLEELESHSDDLRAALAATEDVISPDDRDAAVGTLHALNATIAQAKCAITVRAAEAALSATVRAAEAALSATVPMHQDLKDRAYDLRVVLNDSDLACDTSEAYRTLSELESKIDLLRNEAMCDELLYYANNTNDALPGGIVVTNDALAYNTGNMETVLEVLDSRSEYHVFEATRLYDAMIKEIARRKQNPWIGLIAARDQAVIDAQKVLSAGRHVTLNDLTRHKETLRAVLYQLDASYPNTFFSRAAAFQTWSALHEKMRQIQRCHLFLLNRGY